jgi:hypothetical protein
VSGHISNYGLSAARSVPPPLQGFPSNGEFTQAKAWARFLNRFAVNPTDTQARFKTASRQIRHTPGFGGPRPRDRPTYSLRASRVAPITAAGALGASQARPERERRFNISTTVENAIAK